MIHKLGPNFLSALMSIIRKWGVTTMNLNWTETAGSTIERLILGTGARLKSREMKLSWELGS